MAEDSKELSEQEKYYKSERVAKEKEREESQKKKDKETKEKADTEKLFNKILEVLKSGNLVKIFFLPFKIITEALQIPWIKKVVLIGFIILVAIFGWIFVVNFLLGGGTSVLGTQFSVLASTFGGPIKAIVTPAVNFFSDPVGTVAQYGTFKPPETVEKRKPQGVEIKNFQAKKPIHRADLDPIETVANVKIYALEDSPTQVKFSCFIEDPTAVKNVATLGLTNLRKPAENIIVSGELENSVYVFENQDKSVNVQCAFPSQSTGAIPIGDRQKTIQEKITLSAVYEDFVVRSRLKVYTLESSVLRDLEKTGTNPFKEFKINDPLLSSDRSVRSEQLRAGPAVLSLTLLDAQPLTEGPTYLLGLDLTNDKLSWNGKITQLKSLKIFLPSGFSPAEGRCKEFTYENNLLILKPDILGQYLEREEIDKERFFCDFTIDSSVATNSLDFSLINAEAKFDYAFEAYTTATISQGIIRSTTTVTS
ncbi:MAG: hypothetical protein AABW58_00645 [Nanoarchaeota archaeon]